MKVTFAHHLNRNSIDYPERAFPETEANDKPMDPLCIDSACRSFL